MELLLTEDINHIITAVDDNTSVFKRCELFDGTSLEPHLLGMEYMIRTSMSLTELVKTNINIPGLPFNPSAFLKIWFAWNDLLVDKTARMAINTKLVQYYKENTLEALHMFGDLSKFRGSVTNIAKSTSLDHEGDIYAFITQFIIQQNISPNFIPLLTASSCRLDTIIESLDKGKDFIRKYDLLKKLQILHTLFPTLELKFIMTGSAPRVETAHTFFKSLRPGGGLKIIDGEYYSILFQFFHAHYVQSIFGIVHNDNHMNNVLIQTLDTPITLDITIGSAHARFTTRYIVKFFDWDRASYTMGPENPLNPFFLDIRSVPTFTPGRDFSTFVCFMNDLSIPGFNIILDSLIIGPKPTVKSNTDITDIIEDEVTPLLRDWMSANPLNTIVNPKDLDSIYITISKTDFERCLPRLVKTLRDKLGNDIYDNATNFYLGVSFNDVIIFKGFGCHPMYDSNALQVEQYFMNASKFETLCSGLNTAFVGSLYTYTLTDPVDAAISSGNGSYATLLKNV